MHPTAGRKVSGIRGLRWLFLVFAAALAAASACGGDGPESQPAPPSTTVASGTGIRAVPVARGLDRPVHVAFAPGEPDRLYVVEQPGVVRVLVDGEPLDKAFLDIRRFTGTSPKSRPRSRGSCRWPLRRITRRAGSSTCTTPTATAT